MTKSVPPTYTAFMGNHQIAHGILTELLTSLKAMAELTKILFT